MDAAVAGDDLAQLRQVVDEKDALAVAQVRPPAGRARRLDPDVSRLHFIQPDITNGKQQNLVGFAETQRPQLYRAIFAPALRR